MKFRSQSTETNASANMFPSSQLDRMKSNMAPWTPMVIRSLVSIVLQSMHLVFITDPSEKLKCPQRRRFESVCEN